jgi:hypothetical protein
MPVDDKKFELIVLTHVDADHIEGLVRLFAEAPLPFSVNQVWFNGWRQMQKSHGLLGAVQGEFLSALLARRVPHAWNANAQPWVVPDDGDLPHYELPGGMELTLLSPNSATLRKMGKAWKKAVETKGITPGNLDAAWKTLAERRKFLPTKGLLGATHVLDALLEKQFLKDQAVPNGSSIAFLAEFGGKSALLLGDAHANVVTDSIRRLCKKRGINRLYVDAVKVAHHGSKGNTNEELLTVIESPSYLISSNGEQFSHPDAECIARILRFGHPRNLYFNYHSKLTDPWLSVESQKSYCYEAKVRAKTDLFLANSI